MRILLVSTSVVPLGGKKYGGIEGLVTTFAKGLVQAGEDVTVAAPVGSVVPAGVKLIETVNLPGQQDEDWLVESILMGRLGEFDMIHDFSHRHTFRISPNAIHMMWDNITVNYPFKAKQNVITLSEWQKERFQAMYNQKSLVMPMCVDTDIYHPIDNPARERFLFLGKISADKGVHLALQYAEELGVPLDIVGGLIDSEIHGNAYLNDIRRRCDGDKIKFHFNVDETTKIGFLQNAKALIYPVQMIEAHWLTGIEAWVTGCPTISYATSSKPEIFPDNSWLATDENFFKALMENTNYYNINRVRDLAYSRYATKNVVPKYVSLYQSVINGLRW